MPIKLETIHGLAIVTEINSKYYEVTFDERVALNGELKSKVWVISEAKLNRILI